MTLSGRLILFAAILSGCEKAPTSQDWSVERSQSGDTIVVRNIGTNTSAVNATLTRELAIGKVQGSEQQMFGRVSRAYATPDAGVVVIESGPERVQRFDSLGNFVRAYGSRGGGPGEFLLPGSVALDARGFLHQIVAFPQSHAVFDPAGNFVKTSKLPPGVRDWHLNEDGSIHRVGSLTIRDTTSGATTRSVGAVFHIDPDGRILDTTLAPSSFGTHLRTPYTAEHGPTSHLIPLSPRFELSFGAPGAWVYGNSERYAVHVQPLGGQLLRIESDLEPSSTSQAERKTLAEHATMEIRSVSGTIRLEHSSVPPTKPFYKRLRLDNDGRIWVELYQPATRRSVTRCPPSLQFSSGGAPGTCDDGGKPRPMDEWVEPVVYDVYAPNGELLGRVSLPERAMFQSATADWLWLSEPGEMDAPMVVRYRVSFPRRGL